MSNRIEDLSPLCQERFQLFKAKLDAGQISFVVVSTLRSLAEQQAQWFKGRDSSGKVIDPKAVVTQVDGIIKKSHHQTGNAFDLTFADEHGNPYWPTDPVRWFALGNMAESCGLDWGGRFQPLDKDGLGWDCDHFQIGE